jgi:GNAT superfamily N-acetyltransferase
MREKGAIVAACAWRAWPSRIGHLRVLARPGYRRQGLAQAVAAPAIEEAAGEGLLPQWRARPAASQQLAQSLGLVRLGAQPSLQDQSTLYPDQLGAGVAGIERLGRRPPDSRAARGAERM